MKIIIPNPPNGHHQNTQVNLRILILLMLCSQKLKLPMNQEVRKMEGQIGSNLVYRFCSHRGIYGIVNEEKRNLGLHMTQHAGP
jgi:hypothetical protein